MTDKEKPCKNNPGKTCGCKQRQEQQDQDKGGQDATEKKDK